VLPRMAQEISELAATPKRLQIYAKLSPPVSHPRNSWVCRSCARSVKIATPAFTIAARATQKIGLVTYLTLPPSPARRTGGESRPFCSLAGALLLVWDVRDDAPHLSERV